MEKDYIKESFINYLIFNPNGQKEMLAGLYDQMIINIDFLECLTNLIYTLNICSSLDDNIKESLFKIINYLRFKGDCYERTAQLIRIINTSSDEMAMGYYISFFVAYSGRKGFIKYSEVVKSMAEITEKVFHILVSHLQFTENDFEEYIASFVNDSDYLNGINYIINDNELMLQNEQFLKRVNHVLDLKLRMKHSKETGKVRRISKILNK